jgi:hypothetical protein
MPDSDWELDCGCLVGWNHGAWDWDLTYPCDKHTRSEAIDLADAELKK